MRVPKAIKLAAMLFACMCIGAGLSEGTRVRASASATCNNSQTCVIDWNCARGCECVYAYCWDCGEFPISTGCFTP